ncbi:hypothetical protein OEG86_20570 [Hoeflea alexandrii]|uniref:hypothetical protein n=1 Tax=Hoeflea alexandrii TaxID=288436 RepID=UPI0022701540|nr:hypothetical protein [Hoeflea alexandrii]MCY0154224.1 hypothetical protein [Hoeflea alexandrii]
MIAVIMKAVWRILGFTIPLPIGVILAALAWLHFDKASTIRQAVNERVTEMVARRRDSCTRGEARGRAEDRRGPWRGCR